MAAGDFDVRLFASRCEAASALLGAVRGADAAAVLAPLGGSRASWRRQSPPPSQCGGGRARDDPRIGRQPRGSSVARESIRAPNAPVRGVQRVMCNVTVFVCVHVKTVLLHCNGQIRSYTGGQSRQHRPGRRCCGLERYTSVIATSAGVAVGKGVQEIKTVGGGWGNLRKEA